MRSHDFDAADVSDQPFGWNLPNWLLRRECVARLRIAECHVSPRRGDTPPDHARKRRHRGLSDGSRVEARLLVAADGRNSAMRDALGIGVRTTRFGQKALAFAVTHPVPHDNVSTEIHRSGGPFTFVPLPDRDGALLAISLDGNRARGRAAGRLPEPDFERRDEPPRLRRVRAGRLRGVAPDGLADHQPDRRRFHGQRTALMAEAAHVVPPIGAQGLNMSLADLAR